jgi:hypothetical protein
MIIIFDALGEVCLVSEQEIAMRSDRITMPDLPTSPSVNGQLFTQTAAQLGGSGTTKVLCIR